MAHFTRINPADTAWVRPWGAPRVTLWHGTAHGPTHGVSHGRQCAMGYPMVYSIGAMLPNGMTRRVQVSWVDPRGTRIFPMVYIMGCASHDSFLRIASLG